MEFKAFPKMSRLTREVIVTRKRVKPRPSGRGRKARSPSGFLWVPPINQQP